MNLITNDDRFKARRLRCLWWMKEAGRRRMVALAYEIECLSRRAETWLGIDDTMAEQCMAAAERASDLVSAA